MRSHPTSAKPALLCLAVVIFTFGASASSHAQVTFASNGQQLNDLVGRGVAIADFNADGNLDAFVVNESGPMSQDCRVYFGDGRGQFADSGQRLTSAAPARRPVVHDIDGNGTKDLIVGRAAWMNDGRGRFVAGTSLLVDSDGAMVWQCRLADLNGDGQPDLFAIVTTANMESKGRVYLNDGKGHFQEAAQTSLPGIASSVEMGDVNGDGAIDAVVSGWRNATTDACPNRVLLNDGKGRFTDTGQQLDEEMRHSHGLALGDLDQDGDLDVVLVTQQPPFARLYLNDGKSRFTPGRTVGTTGVEKVAVMDLNGDGRLDIFLACLGPNEVWLNDGKGNFTDTTLRLGKEWSWELALGDFNGDRLPDVFVVNLGVDRTAPPESMMRTRPAEVWLNTSRSVSSVPRNAEAWDWRLAPAFGGPATWFSAAFTIGDQAYVGTGYSARNEFWQYDSVRDVWTRKADYPGKTRGAAVAFAIGDKGYLGLGYGDDNRFADLWEYDPSADRWTQKASLPGGVRDHCAVFAIGPRAYVAGGMTCKGSEDECGELKEVWEYDPRTDRWARKADMPDAIVWSAYFVLNGKGYVEGGQRQQSTARNFWEYDPQADTWTRKAEFPGPVRFRAVGFSLSGKGYISTGIESVRDTTANVLSDLWEYDPQANAWTQGSVFSGSARGAAVAFVLGSRVYIGTGTNSSRGLLRDFWWAAPSPARNR
jgi:N-acetylneuraminic acid mutarotase